MLRTFTKNGKNTSILISLKHDCKFVIPSQTLPTYIFSIIDNSQPWQERTFQSKFVQRNFIITYNSNNVSNIMSLLGRREGGRELCT